MNTLRTSPNPVQDLEELAYPGQAPHLRMYQPGYESFMDQMPVLDPQSPSFDLQVELSQDIMHEVADALKNSTWWEGMSDNPNSFQRTMIAVGTSSVSPDGERQAGSEIVVGHWGTGMATPIHGHASGFMHEEMIAGKILVITYRITDLDKRIVRPVDSNIYQDGVISTSYSTPTTGIRANKVHMLKALSPSTSVHFFPEHIRDARDTQFIPEYFEQVHPIQFKDVWTMIDDEQAPRGSVMLIRSDGYGSQFGDHYVVANGGNSQIIPAPYAGAILDFYSETADGLVILALQPNVAAKFMEFYDIHL